MADRCQITFVFGVLELDLFFGQPVSIDRTNQFLIFLQQALAELLNLFFVHCVSSLSLENLHGSETGDGSICLMRSLSTRSVFFKNSELDGAIAKALQKVVPILRKFHRP